tara:strand:+ start:258 stop:1130 length:873 start_codon:yes stop_codon:yes gene_type:complete
MTQYKYHLDKTSKKFNCPQCGKKKRFVKYVETETGHYAETQYGRCDRETSCGYIMYPNDNSIVNYKYVAPPSIKPSYIDKEILQKTLTKYEINPLATYLNNHYSEDDVNVTIDKYQVGTSNQFNNSTVFWQMDNTGNIRSGKIMAYETTTGKRLKDENDKPLINWVHTALKLPNYILNQCLFGLHLLNDNVKQVAIVESEKTALIMSIEFPQHIWMSTGSLQGFKYEYLEPIKDIEIIAFPDKGGYAQWQKIAKTLNEKGFNIEISKLLEKEEYKDGWDLVDVIQYDDIK